MKVSSLVLLASAVVALPVSRDVDCSAYSSQSTATSSDLAIPKSVSGNAFWTWLFWKYALGHYNGYTYGNKVDNDNELLCYYSRYSGNTDTPASTAGSYAPSPTTASSDTSSPSSEPSPEATPESSPELSQTVPSSPAETSSSAPASATSESPSLSGSIVDDYPTEYKNSCGSIDQWSLTACQCVSFVAWRISQHIDSGFRRSYKSGTWSNANQWDDAAHAAGFTVDNSPRVGSIAQTDAGTWGHVAWVAAIDGDNIQIEEYNAIHDQAYSTRTVSASEFQYIHFPST